jgi:hypothetical protein
MMADNSPSLRLRTYGEDDSLIAIDWEIEAPVSRHPTLPHVPRFEVLFGSQRRVRPTGPSRLLRKAQLHLITGILYMAFAA